MACIRKRRGKFVVDYYDGAGRRRWVTCETKKEANDILSDKLRGLGTVRDSNITLREYAEKWLERVSPTIKVRTLESYTLCFDKHILPALGNIQLRKLQRTTIKEFLAGKQREDEKGKKLAGNTVRIINAALRACLSEAVEDNLIPSNPAAGLTKKLKLIAAHSEDVKAMDTEQLSKLLSKADAWYYPFFLLLARSGLRMGEAIALEIADVDFVRNKILVSKTYDFRHKEVGTPKTGKGREVDMSDQLAFALKQMIAKRREKCFEKNKQMPSLLFPSGDFWLQCETWEGWRGEYLMANNVRRAFRRALKKAELPPHFTPHCLRHTFASLLLQKGKSIAYVQRMLGHASIRLTVDLYGKWLPMGDRDAINELDDPKASMAS